MFRNTVSIWNICCWTCFRHSGCHKSMTDDITLYLNWCFSVLAARIGLRFLGRTDWSHFGHNDLLNSTDCFESESFVHESELCHSCKCLQGWISPCFDCFAEYGCHKFRELHVLKNSFFGSFRHFSCITFGHYTAVHWLWRVDASYSVQACIMDIRAICFRMSLEEWC